MSDCLFVHYGPLISVLDAEMYILSKLLLANRFNESQSRFSKYLGTELPILDLVVA